MKLRKLTNDVAYMISKEAYFDYNADTLWIGTTSIKNIIENHGVTKEEMKSAQKELKNKIEKEIQFAKDSGMARTQIVEVHIDSPRWRLGFILRAVVQFYNRKDFSSLHFDKLLEEAI